MSENRSEGMGLGTVLFLIFLILKLTHTIDWSWWWVFSPLWFPIAMIILFSILIKIFD